MNKKPCKKLMLVIILLGILLAFTIFISLNAHSLAKENKLYRTILKIDTDYNDISIDRQKANSYYNEASLFYEKSNYDLVESNCRLARGYYAKESQGYKAIKSELMSSDFDDKLKDIYLELLDESINIADNMFEACEHFESASRYYNLYFNEDGLNDVSNFDMGGKEIDAINEKIEAHDKAVERYNQLLEDYRLELKKRIKI